MFNLNELKNPIKTGLWINVLNVFPEELMVSDFEYFWCYLISFRKYALKEVTDNIYVR